MKLIVDIGSNYNGSIKIAKELIDKSLEAGVDYVKFQSFEVDDIRTKDHPQYELYKKFVLSKKQHKELKKYTNKFFSTPFNVEAVKLIAKLKVPYFKVASSQALNVSLLKEMSKYDIPIILSTGMINEKGLRYILSLFKIHCVMYCVSEYPCKYDKNTVNEIKKLKKIHPNIGLSCHSRSINDTIRLHKIFNFSFIEKHIKTDKKLNTPDYFHSITIKELKMLCKKIKGG